VTDEIAVQRVMETLWLNNMAAVARARRRARAMAEALGLDAAAVEQVAGELAINCIQHRTGQAPAQMRFGRRGRRLVVTTCNRCAAPPDWQTRKSCGDPRYPIGGYGLPIVGALADRFRHDWAPQDGGCVHAQAEFFLPERRPSGDDRGRRLEGEGLDLGLGQDGA
jgi:hypothetical protein